MSISPSLKAAARAAYRDVWRASSVVFRGDDTILQAFRQKMRLDATAAAQEATTPDAYQQSTQHFRDIAVVLRKNIVQASKVGERDGKDVYRVHMRPETELGDNDTVKNPAPVESSRSARKRYASLPSLRPFLNPNPSESDAAQQPKSTSKRPMFYSALKRAHKERVVPELREEDLEEQFVRGACLLSLIFLKWQVVLNGFTGSGPGGQSINKTENNVQLLHKPTRHPRLVSRDSLAFPEPDSCKEDIVSQGLSSSGVSLDKLMNPGMSKEDMKAAKQRERERRRRKKAKKRAQAKAGGKDQKDEDEDDD
ncbi:hypothetical protein NMY22_g12112 [Coprinellus aureogranulatus]|nr:hypothetical protein NMY22_g12112 [Coprinellus aureogranulatus]